MSLLSKIPKTAVLSSAALVAALVAQTAGAVPINSWTYTVESNFSSWDDTGGTSSIQTYGSGLDDKPTELGWPSSIAHTQQSSVQIDGEVNGSVATNGAAAAGATFTHTNNVLNANYTTLNSFTLNSHLQLASASRSEPTTADLMLSFEGMFSETNNQAPCAVSSSPTPCNDIFVLTNEIAGHGLNSDGELVFQQTFTAGGWEYAAILLIDGLDYLGEDVCTAAGATADCIGLTTIENQENNFDTNLKILSNPLTFNVPGPGSLVMLVAGFGLIGLGFVTRRRQRNDKPA